MEIKIVDTHAHLDMPHFDSDREEMIKRAQENGIILINTIGIDIESSQKAIALAQKYPGIVASVGLHPLEAKHASKEDIEKMAEKGIQSTQEGIFNRKGSNG